MRIIIIDNEDWILQVRSARLALEDNIQEGEVRGYGFEDGKYFGVKRNKNSVRVYPQQ